MRARASRHPCVTRIGPRPPRRRLPPPRWVRMDGSSARVVAEREKRAHAGAKGRGILRARGEGGGGVPRRGPRSCLSSPAHPQPQTHDHKQRRRPKGKRGNAGDAVKKKERLWSEGRLTLRSPPNSPRRVRPSPPLPCPLVRVFQPAHASQGGGYALGGGASGGNGQVPPPCVPTLDPPNTDARPKRCGCMGDACVRGVGGGAAAHPRGGA